MSEQLGRSVIYRTAQADDVTVTALVGAAESREEPDDDGIRQRQMRQVVVTTDASTGIAAPKLGAVIVIDTAEWAVVDVESMSGSWARLTVALIERREVSSPGFRGPR